MAKIRSININDMSGIGFGPKSLDGLANASLKALRRLDTGGRSAEIMRSADARAIRAALDQQQRIHEQARPRLSQFGLFMALPRPALDRINIAMRSTGEGNRRRVARFPLSVACRLMVGGGALEGRTLDISAHGFRMGAAQPHALAIGQECMAEIEGIGHVACNIRQHGRHGINIAFVAPLKGGQRSALAGLLLRLAGEQEHLITRVRELSLAVMDRIEQGLDSGAVTVKDLFVIREPPSLPLPILADDPQAPSGFAEASPPAAPHPLANVMADLAAVALETAMNRFGDATHLALTDRNGNNVVIQSRAGALLPECLSNPEPDAMTIRIARFSQEATLQFRPPSAGVGNGEGLMELSAPLIVRDRRWGCARMLMPLPRT